jgi:transcriptional regulator with XRE-family HTH domain
VATIKVRDLGDYIRDQRRTAQISLRQLASQAGVSNPYLSQIERGLRKPSAEILQQIAKALRISAEALYIQAGILDEREGDGDVVTALLRDQTITERQKQVLLEIYESFRKESDARAAAQSAESLAAAEGLQVDVAAAGGPDPDPEPAAAGRRSPTRRSTTGGTSRSARPRRVAGEPSPPAAAS